VAPSPSFVDSVFTSPIFPDGDRAPAGNTPAAHHAARNAAHATDRALDDAPLWMFHLPAVVRDRRRSKIAVIMLCASRNGVDHDLEVMIGQVWGVRKG